MIAMKRLKRGFAASLALATVFTGVGMSAPADSGIITAASASNTGSISLTHTLVTPEARSANRLLTNSTVRLTARAQISQASPSSAVEFTLPKGLQAESIPAHCRSDSTLDNIDEPSRHTAVTADTWKSFEEQTLVCDLGDTRAGFTNSSVWIEAKVRPELPPNHKFVVEAAVVAAGETLETTSYDQLPTVHSQARIAMGPHINLHSNSTWPGTGYLNSWPAQSANSTRHPHPETEAVSYFRVTHPFVLTTPSQYGNQPLDWDKSEISFDMKPDEVYFPGVTNTKPWRDRQRIHGDAYAYYMPNLVISTVRPTAFSTLNNRDPVESFRGASNDLTITPNASTQKATVSATHVDTSGWTVPIRAGGGENTPLPNKAGNYSGPDYEMLWSRHVEIYTPSQALADLSDFSPRSDNRLPVTLKQPTFKGVGLHETNRPWRGASNWSHTGLGRADGFVETRHYVTSPWGSSPLNTPGVVFSPAFPSYFEGLPGSSSVGDGNGELQYGETMLWSSSNRITAPPGGVTAQFQCVTWDHTLALKDPGNEFHPAQGSIHHAQRYPSTGPVYISGQTGPKAFEDIKWQVQYSDGRPGVNGDVECNNNNRNYNTGAVANWYTNPDAVPGDRGNRPGVYNNIRSVRFVIATDVPTRWDLQVQVPLTPKTQSASQNRTEAWVWNSRSSVNHNVETFDKLSDVRITAFFHDPKFHSMATMVRTPLAGRAEKIVMGTPLSMVEMDVESPVKGGELAEVTLKPYSRDPGRLDVTFNFDDKMTYHRTVSGPQPRTVTSRSVSYRFATAAEAEQIVIEMLTTPQSLNVNSNLTATSRVPGEGSRRNNNAAATMRIESSTPTAVSLTANQDNVDAHPFTSPSQLNSWALSFTNEAPYHEAQVTVYILLPRKGLADNIFAHEDADVITGLPTGTGWGVRGATDAYPRTATPAQIANSNFFQQPAGREDVEVVRLTKRVAPGATDRANLPMMTTMTTDGDKITPHMVYNVDLLVDGQPARSFTGATRAGQNNLSTNVNGGTISGTAWVDGTVADHDGVMPTAGRQGVPNLPIRVTGTSTTGLPIDRATTTNSAGEWSVASVPGGDYQVEFADEEWMDDSDFTTFTVRGESSAVGYTGEWSAEFDSETHRNTTTVTVPASGAADRTVIANAGLIGDSGITVERSTSHDYGYRGQNYITSFTVTNDSDTFVDDVEVRERLARGNIVPPRSAAQLVSGPGSIQNLGTGTVYTVDRLEAGESATIRVTHRLLPTLEEGHELPSTTTSEGFFYGFDAEAIEAERHVGTVAVPVISAEMSWTDSGSWLPSITDPRTGWQTGTDAASDAVLVEPREGTRIPDAEAEAMFGPGESLGSTYTLTNESTVVPVSVRSLLATMTGVELDEEVTFGDRVLEPGESTTIEADFVEKMAQIEVDQNSALADLDLSAVAPRYQDDFARETHNLDDEVTNAFDWHTWAVPFHRYSDLVLMGSARDASGDGVIEADEEGQFTYTWVNKGNLTLTDPRFLGERTNQQPRFESGFNAELAPGEQVRGQTFMSVGAALFNDGIFTNNAWTTATAPLSEDEDPEARTTTTLSQRSESGLDLSIELIEDNGDGSVHLGEEFSYEMLLRNNSGERFTDITMDGPVQVTSGDVTYSLDVEFPESFNGTMRPGDTVAPVTQSVTATESASARGYVDLDSALLSAQSRAAGTDSNGEVFSSNWATDTASVFAEPLTVSAGDGAGATQNASSTTVLYWVLGGIAALMVIALILLLTPARRIFIKTTQSKELAGA